VHVCVDGAQPFPGHGGYVGKFGSGESRTPTERGSACMPSLRRAEDRRDSRLSTTLDSVGDALQLRILTRRRWHRPLPWASSASPWGSFSLWVLAPDPASGRLWGARGVCRLLRLRTARADIGPRSVIVSPAPVRSFAGPPGRRRRTWRPAALGPCVRPTSTSVDQFAEGFTLLTRLNRDKPDSSGCTRNLMAAQPHAWCGLDHVCLGTAAKLVAPQQDDYLERC
jgi:hypothetical protein